MPFPTNPWVTPAMGGLPPVSGPTNGTWGGQPFIPTNMGAGNYDVFSPLSNQGYLDQLSQMSGMSADSLQQYIDPSTGRPYGFYQPNPSIAQAMQEYGITPYEQSQLVNQAFGPLNGDWNRMATVASSFPQGGAPQIIEMLMRMRGQAAADATPTLTPEQQRLQALSNWGYGNFNDSPYSVANVGARENALQTLLGTGWNPSMGYGPQDWAALGVTNPNSYESLNSMLFGVSPTSPNTGPAWAARIPPPTPPTEVRYKNQITDDPFAVQAYVDQTLGGNFFGGQIQTPPPLASNPWDTLNQMGFNRSGPWPGQQSQPQPGMGTAPTSQSQWGINPWMGNPQKQSQSFNASPWGSPWGQ